jgi:chromosome segregation ATPase
MSEDLKEYFDKKFGNFRDEIVYQFHVISEDVISKAQQVAEGVANLNENFDRRIDRLDQKIEEQHKDLLAAIKFSYAELDRRIVYLETELQTLKRRVEQIERRIPPG